MNRFRRIFVVPPLLAIVCTLAPLETRHLEAQEITLEEWMVPWEECRPRDPYVGPEGGTVRHMFFDKDTRSIWFGTDSNTIGRAYVGG